MTKLHLVTPFLKILNLLFHYQNGNETISCALIDRGRLKIMKFVKNSMQIEILCTENIFQSIVSQSIYWIKRRKVMMNIRSKDTFILVWLY